MQGAGCQLATAIGKPAQCGGRFRLLTFPTMLQFRWIHGIPNRPVRSVLVFVAEVLYGLSSQP